MAGKDQGTVWLENEWALRLFDRSAWQQVRLRRLQGMLGSPAGLSCLLLGGDGPVHHRLREAGGNWQAAAVDERAAAACRRMLGADVPVVAEGKLPFADGAFDRVVITDALERVEGDAALIGECHRVLKDAGRLVVHVPHAKPWNLVRPVRRMLGVSEEGDGRVRPGYTPSQLFDVLKDGFDVEEVQHYSRFFAELAETLVQVGAAYLYGPEEDAPAAQGESGPEAIAQLERIWRYYGHVYPMAWLATKLDGVLFFTRGYHLVARARRRVWRPRRTPVLADGRSIAEATLKAKIGTAAPF